MFIDRQMEWWVAKEDLLTFCLCDLLTGCVKFLLNGIYGIQKLGDTEGGYGWLGKGRN